MVADKHQTATQITRGRVRTTLAPRRWVYGFHNVYFTDVITCVGSVPILLRGCVSFSDRTNARNHGRTNAVCRNSAAEAPAEPHTAPTSLAASCCSCNHIRYRLALMPPNTMQVGMWVWLQYTQAAHNALNPTTHCHPPGCPSAVAGTPVLWPASHRPAACPTSHPQQTAAVQAAADQPSAAAQSTVSHGISRGVAPRGLAAVCRVSARPRVRRGGCGGLHPAGVRLGRQVTRILAP